MGNLQDFLASPTGVAVLVGILVLILMTNACHEAAHALVAFLRGDRRESVRARCTLNPLKHIHWFLSIFLPIVVLWFSNGQAIMGGAKPVMIMPHRVGRVGIVLVALAGPIANALFGGLLIVLLALCIHLEWFGLTTFDWVRSEAWRLLYPPLWFTFLLTVLNLLPIPGLDGGHVVAAFLPEKARTFWYRLAPFGMLFLFVGFLWYGGLFYSWGIGGEPPRPNAFEIIQGRVTAYVTEMVRFFEETL